MSFFLLLMTGFALSMDAFAVSVSCGLGGRIRKKSDKIKLAILFGVFQGMMPALAFFLSRVINIESDGWSGLIAFAILLAIGVHMIIESLREEDKCDYIRLSTARMLFLAFATSIDAFATGVTFYLMGADIFKAALIIASTTFFVTLFGTFFGCKLNSVIKKGAEMAGGVILILIGLKFLFESIIG